MKSLTLMNLVLPMSLTALYLFGKQPNKPVRQTEPSSEDMFADIRYVHMDTTNADLDSVENLIEAMIQVESRGKDDAVGDTHLETPSIGCLQIRPVMVAEVNRILKRCKVEDTYYELDDRYSRDKSIMMFRVWKSYHHAKSSLEKIARCWNGGPRGHKNPATLRYWNKVQAYL